MPNLIPRYIKTDKTDEYISPITSATTVLLNTPEKESVEGAIRNLKSITGKTFVKDDLTQMQAITTMQIGDLCFVKQDSEHDNLATLWIYTESRQWEFFVKFEVNIRDFVVDPIDLENEVTGILPLKNMPSDINTGNSGHADTRTIDFNLPMANWVLSTDYPDYQKQADIIVANLTKNDITQIILEPESVIAANNAILLSATKEMNGMVRLYSKKIPNRDLTGKIFVIKVV